MSQTIFVTDNETTAGREIVIVIRPTENKELAKQACIALGHRLDTLGHRSEADKLQDYAGRIDELAQPVQKWGSASGTDDDQQ